MQAALPMPTIRGLASLPQKRHNLCSTPSSMTVRCQNDLERSNYVQLLLDIVVSDLERSNLCGERPIKSL
jgi:hypothetical protein